MVTYIPSQTRAFRALGDPVRWEIMSTLARGPSAVGPLARRFEISRPAISRHLRVLSEAGLVTPTRVGRQNVYRIETSRVQEAEAALRALWRDRLGSLKRPAEEESS